MKTFSMLLAALALLVTDAALAASAVVTSVVGTAQVQTGTGAARTLRQGDEVQQGDVVSTAPGSSLVMKFDDGQVTALTQNSRLAITAYQYNTQARTGNMLLSLLRGGLRAVTGFIGHNQPQNVAFRAGTATIGIRGTDGTIVFEAGEVVVTVADGAMTLTFAGQTITIPAGQAAIAADGRITQASAQQIFNRLSPAFQQAIGDAQALQDAINNALQSPPPGNNNDNNPPATAGQTPGPNNPPGGAGGGSSSNR